MKPSDVKLEYIRLRADGNSQSFIAERLHISKTTCTNWEQELSEEIDTLRRAKLAELYESYGMTKEARIKNLGDTLTRIDLALSKADFSDMPPSKLLDYKLKLTQALKEEYVGTKPVKRIEELSSDGIMESINDLLDRIRDGEVTPEQARTESEVLSQLLRAYDTKELEAKIDMLDSILERRV